MTNYSLWLTVFVKYDELRRFAINDDLLPWRPLHNSADLPFPSPPFPAGINPPNPTIGPSPPVVGSAGSLMDDHATPGSFVTPYSAKSITATQYYRYTCPCANNGNPVPIYGPLSIVRSVTFLDNRWQFIITKDGNIAKIDPL